MTDAHRVFRDKQITVHQFAHDVLVRCPRCQAQARVYDRDGGDNVYHAKQWRVSCLHCGYHRDRTAACLHFYNGAAGIMRDPVFHLPVWLQRSCCGGNLLWAYNLDHLSFVEAFVAATIRQRAEVPPAGAWHRRMTMIAKLPAWLKSAKHRAEILRTITRLQQSVRAQPVR